MAKNFPFFKFVTSKWLTGNIAFEDLDVQGLFINVCSVYWERDGVLLIKDIQKNDILEINDNTLMEILKLMESKKSNAKINLNNGYVAQKKYNEFVIKKELRFLIES